MNSKERVFAVLEGRSPDRVPTGFWMHFPPQDFCGENAVKTHLEYFKKTRTDICKVMTELTYPCDHSIQRAQDWEGVRSYGANAKFITEQADIISRIAEHCTDAPLTATVHGVIASSSHTLLGVPKYDVIGRYAQLYHLRTNPQAISDAYRHVADTLCVMARAVVRAGAEGVYYAALGGEKDGFTDEEHARYIAPLDKMVIDAAYDAGARFVILHMCKPKVNLRRFADYRCDIVNWGVRESGVSLREGREIFPGKVMLGGLDNRQGSLIDGDMRKLEQDVAEVIRDTGKQKLILGSDCTLPGNIPYEHIAAVADACGRYCGKEE